jgi:Flp pilus assembly protein TadD
LYGQQAPPTADPGISRIASTRDAFSDAEKLYRTGKFDTAEQEYKSLIASGTEAVRAYAGLARLYLKEKKSEEASTAAAKAVALDPTSQEARIALGEVHFREGKIAEAENEFATLVRAGTPQARAYLGMARVSRAASFYRQAKRMIDRARQLDPSDPDIERFWMSTLSLQERIKALQDYLGSESNDSAETRRNLEHEVAVLQDETAQPTRKCQLSTKISSTQTSFRPLLLDASHIRGYGLNVELNGAGANLMVDTGASGILIDRKVAERAGIKRVIQSEIGGIGDEGKAAGYIGYADSIKIGELQFKECHVEVIERNSVTGDDGLIGTDVFSHFLVDLDFPNGKLKLSELPSIPDEQVAETVLDSRAVVAPSSQLHDRYKAPEMKTYWPLLRFGHDLLIPTKLNDSPPKLFLIDSGAFNNMISPQAAREVTKVSNDSDTKVKGLNGSVKNVLRANELILSFANFREINRDMVAVDMTNISDSAGTEISGILGFAMLRMIEIKIDYRDGLVDFNYDPHRWR